MFARHKGLHSKSAFGSGGNDGEVADAFKTHRKRAGNRRRRKREHIDFGADFAEHFLLPHAEAVLLINDDEPQIFKLRFVGKKFMRADHDVDRAVSQAREYLGRFFSGAKA